MSKAGRFVKKHPWEAAGLAAAAMASGGAAAGLFGAGAAGAAGAGAFDAAAAGGLGMGLEAGTGAAGAAGGGLLGDFTAAAAGDAYLPGALGATGEGSPSLGSTLGSKFAPGNGAATMKNIARGANAAQKFGLLNAQQPMPPSGGMPQSSAPITNTVLYPQQPVVGGPVGGIDPKLLALLMQMRGGQA